ncbi:MAG: Gfo/Idh/MocA family protein [Ardenticatenaceae bacterium]
MRIRWGILSTGRIAGIFARDLALVPDAELVAVGSRAQASADGFAERYGVPRSYGSYEALAADPDVDVIYVATPHVLHAANSLLCLRAGKAVLCEKPFTVNAAEARAVVGTAREQGLFLMEAMWTRFLPLFVHLREIIAGGVIGAVRMLDVDFGFRATYDSQHRLFNWELAGGTLLDIGVYAISLASMLFGAPRRAIGLARLGETGVDEQAGIVLEHDNGAFAVIATSFRVSTPIEARLYGTEGRITVHPRWYRSTRMTLYVEGQEEQVIEMPVEGSGYQYEAAEVGRCLRQGLQESPVMPLDETVRIMETLDSLREPWGLRYPGE